MFERLPRKYFVATLLYCAGILLLSSSSDPIPHEQLFPNEDKVAHAILYAGLATTLSVGLQRARMPLGTVLRFWIPVAFACLYGASDELHQLFVPGRSADLWDLAADACGGLLAQFAIHNRLVRRSSAPVSSPSSSV